MNTNNGGWAGDASIVSQSSNPFIQDAFKVLEDLASEITLNRYPYQYNLIEKLLTAVSPDPNRRSWGELKTCLKAIRLACHHYETQPRGSAGNTSSEELSITDILGNGDRDRDLGLNFFRVTPQSRPLLNVLGIDEGIDYRNDWGAFIMHPNPAVQMICVAVLIVFLAVWVYLLSYFTTPIIYFLGAIILLCGCVFMLLLSAIGIYNSKDLLEWHRKNYIVNNSAALAERRGRYCNTFREQIAQLFQGLTDHPELVGGIWNSILTLQQRAKMLHLDKEDLKLLEILQGRIKQMYDSNTFKSAGSNQSIVN